jgi:hypothetical protein
MMNSMEAPQPMGFRAQMRELLSKEPVSLVAVTERSLPRFEQALTELGQQSAGEAGMLPMTGNTGETPAEWLAGSKGLWLFGDKQADFTDVSNVSGFVNVYAPEHNGSINDWLLKRGMRAYDHGAVLELSSFAKNEAAKDMEVSANKQALAKVFMDDAYKDVRAVTTWVTHTSDNKLDPSDIAAMKKLGGWPLGSLKYHASETVDSTAFLITRRQFMDALTGVKRQ